jgi:8-oxo-dGTP pyrophosphatase MutT (NUDIX family)
VQYAALPFRPGVEGVEILLVTSRETQRWVIPKGWPMRGRKPHATAAREAFEEAGVVGLVGRNAIGAYRYVKLLRNGAPLVCEVDVFPLLVERQRKHWREQHQRTAHWFNVEEAAEAVREPELQALIARFGGLAGAAALEIRAAQEGRKAKSRGKAGGGSPTGPRSP